MKLNIDAICLLSAIIDKIEIDDNFISEMLKIGTTAKGKEAKEQERIKTMIGMKIFLKISSKMHLVKNELIDLISYSKNISKEEAKEVDMLEFFKEIIKDEGLISFFKQKVMSE